MSVDILDKVVGFCHKNSLLAQQEKIVVGVSGGPDSLALLHLLTQLRYPFELTLIVAHLNHQLREADAAADEAFVRATATAWNLPIFVDSRPVARLAKQYKQSIEETARQVRYTFLWQVAAQTGATKIAVAHHADDQVETILMHFLRGSGLAGLRGMLPEIDMATLRLFPGDSTPPSTPAPRLIRPLLAVTRTEIERYCQENSLAPRQDSSNQDQTFFRNRLRHDLIPYLESYNPNIRQIVRRTAQVITADVEILDAQGDQAWARVVNHQASDWIEFDLGQWRDLPLGLKRAMLRRAVQALRRGLRDIGFEHIEDAVDIVEKGVTGLQATLPQGLLLTTGYQSFVVAPAGQAVPDQDFEGPQLSAGQVVEVNLPGTTLLPGGEWQLKVDLLPYEGFNLETVKQAGRWEAFLDAEVVGEEAHLRSRRPGDRYQPLGMSGHRQKVNEFMINEKIPAGWRDGLPLLVVRGEVVWVCGYRPAEQARLCSTTQTLFHLTFEKR